MVEVGECIVHDLGGGWGKLAIGLAGGANFQVTLEERSEEALGKILDVTECDSLVKSSDLDRLGSGEGLGCKSHDGDGADGAKNSVCVHDYCGCCLKFLKKPLKVLLIVEAGDGCCCC